MDAVNSAYAKCDSPNIGSAIARSVRATRMPRPPKIIAPVARTRVSANPNHVATRPGSGRTSGPCKATAQLAKNAAAAHAANLEYRGTHRQRPHISSTAADAQARTERPGIPAGTGCQCKAKLREHRTRTP